MENVLKKRASGQTTESKKVMGERRKLKRSTLSQGNTPTPSIFQERTLDTPSNFLLARSQRFGHYTEETPGRESFIVSVVQRTNPGAYHAPALR